VPNIKVSVRENTSSAQIEEALTAHPRDGYDLVIAHGFQFAEAAQKVHVQFPKTWFAVNTAKVAEAPNLASFDNRWGDAGLSRRLRRRHDDEIRHDRRHQRDPGSRHPGI
jgi:basic membrane protein A